MYRIGIYQIMKEKYGMSGCFIALMRVAVGIVIVFRRFHIAIRSLLKYSYKYFIIAIYKKAHLSVIKLN